MEKYKGKLVNMNIKDKNQKNKIFRGWKVVKYQISFKDLSKETVNLSPYVNYLSYEDVSLYDTNGNMILYYIIRELNKLLVYNDNKTIKNTITFFIIDVINRLFEMFNTDSQKTNFEIKRFNYILKSKSYVYDITEKGYGLEGFYDEYKDIDDPDPSKEEIEQRDTDIEESEALDVDIGLEAGEIGYDPDDSGLDYEIDYESGVNFNRIRVP